MSEQIERSAISGGDGQSSSSRRHRLRHRTQAAHARLDALFASLDLAQAGVYRLFLKCQAPALLAVEQSLDAAGAQSILVDWPDRRRSAAIIADLRRLGDSAKAASHSILPSRGAMLGALYVLEGSRLGAQLLVRKVRASRDPSVTEAGSYLAHGTGRQFWPTYVAALEANELDANEELAMEQAALNVFDLFTQEALIVGVSHGNGVHDGALATVSQGAPPVA